MVFARWHQSARHLIHASIGPPESTTRMASRSVQHFCTAHGRVSSGMLVHVLLPKNCPLAWGNLDPIYYMGAHPSPQVHNPNGISIASAVFAGPPNMDGSIVFARLRQCAPQCNKCFLGPQQVHTQTASRSVQPFLQGS